MNYWVVVANDGHRHRAVVCEKVALEWVRERMRKEGYGGLHIDAYPVTCHWTARVISGNPRPDTEQDDG